MARPCFVCGINSGFIPTHACDFDDKKRHFICPDCKVHTPHNVHSGFSASYRDELSFYQFEIRNNDDFQSIVMDSSDMPAMRLTRRQLSDFVTVFKNLLALFPQSTLLFIHESEVQDMITLDRFDTYGPTTILGLDSQEASQEASQEQRIANAVYNFGVYRGRHYAETVKDPKRYIGQIGQIAARQYDLHFSGEYNALDVESNFKRGFINSFDTAMNVVYRDGTYYERITQEAGLTFFVECYGHNGTHEVLDCIRVEWIHEDGQDYSICTKDESVAIATFEKHKSTMEADAAKLRVKLASQEIRALIATAAKDETKSSICESIASILRSHGLDVPASVQEASQEHDDDTGGDDDTPSTPGNLPASQEASQEHDTASIPPMPPVMPIELDASQEASQEAENTAWLNGTMPDDINMPPSWLAQRDTYCTLCEETEQNMPNFTDSQSMQFLQPTIDLPYNQPYKFELQNAVFSWAGASKRWVLSGLSGIIFALLISYAVLAMVGMLSGNTAHAATYSASSCIVHKYAHKAGYYRRLWGSTQFYASPPANCQVANGPSDNGVSPASSQPGGQPATTKTAKHGKKHHSRKHAHKRAKTHDTASSSSSATTSQPASQEASKTPSSFICDTLVTSDGVYTLKCGDASILVIVDTDK